MLQFIDCPNCKKRVRDVARSCHHCGHQISHANPDGAAPENADGGYDEQQDDFDYDEYLEKEFENKPPIRKLWVYVTWVLLFAMLFPVALQIIAALRPS